MQINLVQIEISQRIHGLQTEHANAVAERELKITMLSQQLSKIEEQFRLFKEQNADNCVAEDWHARGRRGQVSLPLPPVLTAKFDEPSHALKTEYDMHNSISQTNNLFHKQLARGMQSSEEYNKELESAKLNVDKINAAINAASDHDITSANDVSGVGADYPIHVWNHKLKKLVRPGGPPPEKKEAISKAYSSEFFKYGKDSLALRYKGPGVNPFSRFSDKYFWFDDKPNSTDPQHYPIYPSAKRHEVAAWLTQTGYGLLYFSTKYFSTYPQSHPRQVTILALQYADELVKIGDFGFSFKIDGQKHVFELPTPHVRDARIKRGFWIGRLDEVIEAAKGMRAKMESSAGYKSWFIRLESDPTLKMI